jgi:hypothetical protein
MAINDEEAHSEGVCTGTSLEQLEVEVGEDSGLVACEAVTLR